MPTPRAGYKLKDGTRVPGTTTIISRFKDSGGLIHWAYEQGRDGLDYRVTRDSAADAGTLGHWMVEQSIDGKTNGEVLGLLYERAVRENVSEETIGNATRAYLSYRKWASQSKLKIIAQEMLLVSEIHKFGGTPDAVGEIDGQLCILDWKTGNALYRDALVQVAAYKWLWEENHPDQLIKGGFHICRFSKEHGDFVHAYYDELDDAWEQFLLFRRAYDLDKQLKKRAA